MIVFVLVLITSGFEINCAAMKKSLACSTFLRLILKSFCQVKESPIRIFIVTELFYKLLMLLILKLAILEVEVCFSKLNICNIQTESASHFFLNV